MSGEKIHKFYNTSNFKPETKFTLNSTAVKRKKEKNKKKQKTESFKDKAFTLRVERFPFFTRPCIY